jgi:hypothetical protein
VILIERELRIPNCDSNRFADHAGGVYLGYAFVIRCRTRSTCHDGTDQVAELDADGEQNARQHDRPGGLSIDNANPGGNGRAKQNYGKKNKNLKARPEHRSKYRADDCECHHRELFP